MYKSVMVLILIVSSFLIGLSLAKPTTCGASCVKQIATMDVTAFSKAITNEDEIIIDVRTPEEFAQGHIQNAVNADFNDLSQFKAYLDTLDKNQTYLIYCRTGNRSAQAQKMMEEKGFTHISNLDGGIVSWQAAGHPLVK